MPPQQQSKAKSGWEDAPSTGGWEDVTTVDSLTANPKKQGTYRMVPPSGSDVKSGIMIPYGNVNLARQQGFAFDPHNGDDTRYAHDLFTELKGKGKAPSVDPTKNNDEDLTNSYGVVPEPARGSADWYKRTALETAHGTIDSLPTIGAGIADLTVGVPAAATGPGDVLAVGAANAAGSALGEGAKQGLNHFIFRETQTPKERATNVGVQAALGGTLGAAGKVVSIPLGKAARSLGLAADESAKAGFRMLPSEAAGTEAGMLESYPKGSIFTKGQMAKWREMQNKETEAAAQKLADNISSQSLSRSGSREEAGNAIRKGIEQHMDDFSNSQRSVYGQLGKDANAAGVQVPRKDVIAAAQKELDRINRVHKETGAGGPTDKFRVFLKNIVNNKNPTASFEAMKDARSSMLATVRSMDSGMSDPEKSVISTLAKTTGDAIEDGLKSSKNPGLAGRWRAANDVTREEHQAFLHTLVKNLAEKKHPEDIALILRGNSAGAVSSLGIDETRAAMNAIPKNMVPQVQKQMILDTVYEATGNGASSFNEKQFAKKFLNIGDERGEVLFGSNWKNVKEFATLLNRIGGEKGSAAALANPETLNRLGLMAAAVIGGAGGARGGIETGVLEGGAALASQYAMWKTIASALTNPEAAENILNGLRRTARLAPYIGGGGYNSIKTIKNKTNDLIDKAKQDIIGDAKAIGGQSSVSTPKDLIDKAKQRDPSAQGQVAYAHTAVNPDTGHKIGSNGNGWFDVQTGQQVA